MLWLLLGMHLLESSLADCPAVYSFTRRARGVWSCGGPMDRVARPVHCQRHVVHSGGLLPIVTDHVVGLGTES